MIQVKKITLAPADIIAMFAVPQKLLPAPPAGYVNNVLGITHDMTFATTAYTVATIFAYGDGTQNNPPVFMESICLISLFNTNVPCVKPILKSPPFTAPYDGIGNPFSTTKDFYVTTDAQAATGDSNIDVYIVYEQKIISP